MIAATTAGVIKQLIESFGLSISVYRDAAPSIPDADGKPVPTVPLPYVTVRDRLQRVPDRDGAFDPNVKHTLRETVAVDVWQSWRNLTTGGVTESYTLVDQISSRLHGAAGPTGSPWRVFGITVESSVRLLDPDANVVHDALTVTVYRESA